MTHKNTPPDRIWACPDGNEWGCSGSWDTGHDGQGPEAEYIRADLVPTWRPIETAPMTDDDELKEVIGLDPNGSFPMMWFEGMWVDTFSEPRNPTKWMPLPGLPK